MIELDKAEIVMVRALAALRASMREADMKMSQEHVDRAMCILTTHLVRKAEAQQPSESWLLNLMA